MISHFLQYCLEGSVRDSEIRRGLFHFVIRENWPNALLGVATVGSWRLDEIDLIVKITFTCLSSICVLVTTGISVARWRKENAEKKL